jgi:nucleoside-diphosphate-sugar epimerase
MTRTLVTGGSGFIGKHLVSALIARGREVRVFDLQPPSRALQQIEYVRGSVLDRDLMHRAMDGVDEVYHLAGLPGSAARPIPAALSSRLRIAVIPAVFIAALEVASAI